MSREILNKLIEEANALLSKESKLFSDASKYILSYKIGEAKEILGQDINEEIIKIYSDGNGWAMLGGLNGAIDLYKQKKCTSVQEAEQKNRELKIKKSIKRRDYTGDDYIFFDKSELEIIKKNLENPIIAAEWERIQSVSREYSAGDSKNIACNYKAWRLLPFNFVTDERTEFAAFEMLQEDGQAFIDKIAFEESGVGKTQIDNADFDGNFHFVSSDAAETFGNTGRQPVKDVLVLGRGEKIKSKQYFKAGPGKNCTLKLFIKQEKLFDKPLLIRAVFYDKGLSPVGSAEYKWNMPTNIRWDYIFERSCADAIVYLLTGDLECAEKAKNELMYMLDDMKSTGVLHFMKYGEKPFDDGYGTVHIGRAMAGICMIYDIIRKIPGFIACEEAAKIRRGIFFIADYLGQSIGGANKGLEYFYELSDKSQLLRGGNWTTDQYIGLAYFSMVFPEHPLSFIYLQNSKAVICEHLDKLTNSEGIWPESMRYHCAVLQHLTFYAIALKRYDGTDFSENKKFKMMYEFMLNVQLPQYEYKNNEISHLIFGDDNLGTGRNYFHFNIASKLFRENDGAFADRLLTTWKKAGGYISFGGLNGWLLPFIMIDFEHQPKDKTGGLKSISYPEFGVAVMRNNAETDKDTHVTIVCSENFGAHGHFDLGSFSYFFNRTPVSLDPCVVSYFENSLEWYRSSRAHSTLQFNGKNVLRSNGLCLVADNENGIKYFESNYEYDYLILTVNNAYGKGRQTRHIILEKVTDYLVIYDEIEGFTGNTAFNLPLSACESSLVPGGVFSKGLFDVDVYTDVILPEGAEISLEKGAVAPGCLPSETQDYVRIYGKDNDSFLVVICPVKRGQSKIKTCFENNCISIGTKKIKLRAHL